MQSLRVTQVEKAFVLSLIFEVWKFTGYYLHFKMNECTIQFFKTGEVNMNDNKFQTVANQIRY